MITVQKTPNETDDWQINWATRGLGTDTIVASAWAVAPSDMGIASPAPTFTDSTATVWLSGGTVGVFYTITNTITTAGGRTLQESFVCSCVAQQFI